MSVPFFLMSSFLIMSVPFDERNTSHQLTPHCPGTEKLQFGYLSPTQMVSLGVVIQLGVSFE